jgi:AraC-like DNA-binding protein
MAFVRHGAYRRRADGVEYVVDRTTGWVRRPGEEWSTAPFTTAYEELTVLELDPDRIDDLPDLAALAGPVTIRPGLALAHRLLIGSLSGDALAVDEGVLHLARCCAASADGHRTIGRRRSTATARRRLVADSVELLNNSYREPIGLLDLARRVGTSPYHLSRVFREVTGTTISQYRTNLRVHAVLDRLEQGDADLSAVAADTGFADHGHMTRTVTGLLGEAPSVLRTRLRARSTRPDEARTLRSA